ncbi:MAG TPA: sigma-70 family RNA polymerase sigma factor [Polyangiaceae bacterium]|nr:sigma-70 family RNA polymerase sigma factor [Polyangiaceae bacterium]
MERLPLSQRPLARVDAAPRSGAVIALHSDSDAALVRALREREPHAGTALFDRYGMHVRRVLARVLGPDPELGDLLQDVFVSALSSIHTLEDPSALRAWLTRMAVFTARGRIRRRSRWRFLKFVADDELPEPLAPAQDAEGSQALSAVYRVLKCLPADQRIVFALRVFDGMELNAVATACGVSLSTAKRRLARAQTRFMELSRREPVLADWVAHAAEAT